MLTKNHFIVFSLHINRFHLPFFFLPLRCITENTEGFNNLFSIIPGAFKNARTVCTILNHATFSLQYSEPFELINVDANDPKHRVQIRIRVR